MESKWSPIGKVGECKDLPPVGSIKENPSKVSWNVTTCKILTMNAWRLKLRNWLGRIDKKSGAANINQARKGPQFSCGSWWTVIGFGRTSHTRRFQPPGTSIPITRFSMTLSITSSEFEDKDGKCDQDSDEDSDDFVNENTWWQPPACPQPGPLAYVPQCPNVNDHVHVTPSMGPEHPKPSPLVPQHPNIDNYVHAHQSVGPVPPKPGLLVPQHPKAKDSVCAC